MISIGSYIRQGPHGVPKRAARNQACHVPEAAPFPTHGPTKARQLICFHRAKKNKEAKAMAKKQEKGNAKAKLAASINGWKLKMRMWITDSQLAPSKPRKKARFARSKLRIRHALACNYLKRKKRGMHLCVCSSAMLSALHKIVQSG